MRKSQAWSMDIMIAFIIFIGTIFVFYSIVSNKQSVKDDELQDDASKVLENVVSEDPDLGIVDGIEVDDIKLQELLEENYSELKKKLRIENEFCIYLEDEEGNIIYMNPDDLNQPGIGSGKIFISNQPCK